MARKILIVDDIPFVRKTIAQIATEAFYQVVGEAGTGEEAIELYRTTHPDVVTMDVVMPDMTGIEATRQILKMHREARIVILSALGHEQLIMEAINAGAKDFILKPFLPRDLLRSLDHALKGAETVVRKVQGA